MKSFLSHLVDRLDIDSGNTRVGFVMFATQVGLTFNLNKYDTVSSIKAAISSIQYSTGGTNTDAALAYVRTTMLRPAAGDRVDVPNIVAVITDGRSDNPQATQVFADVYYSNNSTAGSLAWGSLSECRGPGSNPCLFRSACIVVSFLIFLCADALTELDTRNIFDLFEPRTITELSWCDHVTSEEPLLLLLFICHKTHIIMKYTCRNYKNRQDNMAFKLY